jgi:hypothetical protein
MMDQFCIVLGLTMDSAVLGLAPPLMMDQSCIVLGFEQDFAQLPVPLGFTPLPLLSLKRWHAYDQWYASQVPANLPFSL